MSERFSIPWADIYDYTIECGCAHDPYEFVKTALNEMRSLVAYDQGLAYCLDENRQVKAQCLVNIKSRWSTMYLEYYSHLESTRQSLNEAVVETYGMPLVRQISWSDEPITEFLANYIMARGVTYSLTFVLFDLNGLPRAAFSLDRTRQARFTEAEMAVVRLAVAQLGNLYKNFFVDPADVPGQRKRETDSDSLAVLTKREREVVDLLCQGLSPAHVARTLHISVSTAYKHISHIYKKLGVSSQQELLVRVLGR